MTIRILVVDDYKDWRSKVRLLLQVRPEWEVISEESDGLEAVQKAGELKPDLIVLDIGLPGLNGIEAARRIHILAPESRIIFLSQESSPDVVQEALGSGAGGYVVKANAGSELIAAVEAVMQGRRFISSRLAAHEFTDTGNTQITQRPYSEEEAALGGILLRAIAGAHADMGTLQLYDSATRSLRIVSHFGFSEEYLTFFRETSAGHAACGTALERGTRVIVCDVATDPIFEGTMARDVVLTAGVRAVHSTPLLGPGEFLGVLSCHRHQVGRPSDAELCAIDLLAREAVDLIQIQRSRDSRTI